MKYFILFLVILPFAVGDEVIEMVKKVDPGEVKLAGDEFLKYLIQSIGGIKGLKLLGIVGVVSQVIMRSMQTSFLGGLAGKWRLMVVYLMNLIGGTTALMLGADAMSLPAALLHSNTLANVSVFGHQAYKQFVVKKAEGK